MGTPARVTAAIFRGYPLPPAFDPKLFLGKDLGSSLHTELIRTGGSSVRSDTDEYAHFRCRCIVRFPTLWPNGSRTGPVRLDTTLALLALL